MAVTGRKPKDDEQKVTRHQLTQGWTEVPDIPYEGDRPELTGTGRLGIATKAWWQRISTMPHCILWTPSDWQFALDTLRLHAAFVRGEMARAGELRVREKQMGTTLDARRDLRIRYVSPFAGVLVADPEDDEETAMQSRVADFEAERRRRLLEDDA